MANRETNPDSISAERSPESSVMRSGQSHRAASSARASRNRESPAMSRSMSPVVTYRLAYLPLDVNVCAECVERNDHGLGTLGPVQHGLHDGACDSPGHGDPAKSEEV